MTNPGSFKFRDSKEWEDFEKGYTSYNVFEALDKPDLTMQNIIHIIREGFKRTSLGEPNGVVRIFNISNIVESKKENVEEKHQKALQIIQKEELFNVNHLIEPVANDEYEFVNACSKVDFIIMGFVDKVFQTQVLNLTAWSENPVVKNKLVYARDNSGRLSHPRRWRTETYLMEKAIERLVNVLNKDVKEIPKTGYTFLRWNGEYGREAKFVVRNNESNQQSIFIPGRVQDLVWTSVDLANTPELKDWSTFENETVDDLDEVAF